MKKKRKILLSLVLAVAFLVSGCSKVDLSMEDEKEDVSEDNTQDTSNETESDKADTEDVAENATTDNKDESDDATTDASEEDENAETDETKEDSFQVDFRVICFYEEEIDSVPVSIVKKDSFDDGVVYSYDIVYDVDAIDYCEDSDRLHIGTFLYKEDEIYLITDTRDNHKEQDFYDYGVLVYSKEDYSDERSGYKINLHNDGYLCRCSYYDTISESGGTGYYAEYVFNSDKVLTYFRTGYGAEKFPIEITTNTDKDFEDAFSTAKESSLTKEDVTVTYNGFDIGPDTSYQEIIDTLGYPEQFEDSNNGFVSAEDGYRWQLNYPEAYGEYEISITCVSPSNDPEGPDSCVEHIYFEFPTNRGVAIYDSIYTLADVYGAPDEIREASWAGDTEVVYIFDGNELEFTIGPDNTIRLLRVHFAE